jgi:hypothetical protein
MYSETAIQEISFSCNNTNIFQQNELSFLTWNDKIINYQSNMKYPTLKDNCEVNILKNIT